jgi:hypothetical protein
MTRLIAAAGLAILAVASPRAAQAKCPDADDAICRPYTSLLLPSAYAVMYAPLGDTGPWYGGGAEIVLMTWADNSPAYGPSHGKIRFDIGMLGSTEAGSGAMMMYRGGAAVSFERNASRRWLIPYFGANVGGLWTEDTGTRGFVDAGGGVYLYYGRGFVVDLESSWLFPFGSPGQFAGARAQLAVSLALW